MSKNYGNTIKNMHVMVIPEEKKKNKKKTPKNQNIFETIMTENFPQIKCQTSNHSSRKVREYQSG